MSVKCQVLVIPEALGRLVKSSLEDSRFICLTPTVSAACKGDLGPVIAACLASYSEVVNTGALRVKDNQLHCLLS